MGEVKTVDDVIREVKAKAEIRTRYEGQPPRWDEMLVAEVERLRGSLDSLRNYLGDMSIERPVGRAIGRMKEQEAELELMRAAAAAFSVEGAFVYEGGKIRALQTGSTPDKDHRFLPCEAVRLMNAQSCEIGRAVKELERLRAIVERLPRTADGAVVVPGMRIVTADGSCAGLWMCLEGGDNELNIGDPTDLWDGYRISDCYSTREAAEAARNAEQPPQK